MGVENNECVIATTWNSEAMGNIKQWVLTLSEQEQSLFVFVPGLTNGKETLFLAPSGSKKGWDMDKEVKHLRDVIISYIKLYDYEDGSSPFTWVEVGYGEYGQKVLRGNCKNVYGDEDYAV